MVPESLQHGLITAGAIGQYRLFNTSVLLRSLLSAFILTEERRIRQETVIM